MDAIFLGTVPGPNGDELALCDAAGHPLPGPLAGRLVVEDKGAHGLIVRQTFRVRRAKGLVRANG